MIEPSGDNTVRMFAEGRLYGSKDFAEFFKQD